MMGDFFEGMPQETRQKVARFIYDQLVIGENVENRRASGETVKDFYKWRAEVMNERIKDCLAVLEFFE
jgi:hypothetical protein